MVTRRTAKSKGSSMEYTTQYSFQKSGVTDMYRTAERGFQRQYDLQSDYFKIVVECKRLAGFSWNQLLGFYLKLKDNAPRNYTPYLVFRGNRQPACVFYSIGSIAPIYQVRLFEDVFGVWEKHPSSREEQPEIKTKPVEALSPELRKQLDMVEMVKNFHKK